ncbi:MAG: PrpF family protein [Ahrensia sp.]|nr:PrpF family protein [Ahrensia sp.]
MSLRDVPALFMRGGTSKALVFDIKDLPEDRADWDRIFLSAMGSPDPNMRQLDGMGGGLSSLSKICVVGPASRADADVDYTFGQVSIDGQSVDYAGNCGNMVSAMGPAALEFGYVARPPGDQVRIRVHNTNTGKLIVSRFPVHDGLLDPHGDLAIDGVAGTAAPIRLEFMEPGGAKTGNLLPSRSPVDELVLPDGRRYQASLVDAANPCVFVAAEALDKTGTEHPEALAADGDFIQTMELIRCAGQVRMGMSADMEAAAEMRAIPKVAIVAEPQPMETISGGEIRAEAMDIVVRMLSMEQPHRAVPITGAICLAIACRIPGSIPATLCAGSEGPLTLAHPSGTILVDSDVVSGDDGLPHAVSGTVYRTARKLFTGRVHYRD